MTDTRQQLDTILWPQFGLPQVFPEPEVVAADLSRIRCKSLAGIIVNLIGENEPMLRASHDGASVSVRDPDGNVMQFTIGEGKNP
jgi:hypothetical protein